MTKRSLVFELLDTDSDSVEELLRDFNEREERKGRSKVRAGDTDAEGRTFLMLAAEHGREALVRELLPLCDPQRLLDGTSALMMAAEGGHVECVRLLAPVSDWDARNRLERNALMIATCEGHVECARILLAHHAPDLLAQDVEGNSLLMLAARAGCVELVGLFWAGSDWRTSDYQEAQALTLAAGEGRDEAVQTLLGLGARDEEGASALLAAVRHPQCVRLLLESGCRVHVRGSAQQTALMLAAAHGPTQSVRLLLPFFKGQERDISAEGSDALRCAVYRAALLSDTPAEMEEALEICALLAPTGRLGPIDAMAVKDYDKHSILNESLFALAHHKKNWALMDILAPFVEGQERATVLRAAHEAGAEKMPRAFAILEREALRRLVLPQKRVQVDPTHATNTGRSIDRNVGILSGSQDRHEDLRVSTRRDTTRRL